MSESGVVVYAKDLPKHLETWYKLHVFLYDLRNFREVPTSQERLDSIIDPSYLGMPYFDAGEVELLKSIYVEPSVGNFRPKDNSEQEGGNGGDTLENLIESSLQERLERRGKKREESGDYRVCAAHDIAPVLEKAFNIDPKLLAKDEKFLATMERCGLKLDDNAWSGLMKKQFKPGKKHKKR